MSYNLGSKPRVLIGNWWEDRTLVDNGTTLPKGGSHRDLDTKSRVLPSATNTGDLLQSTSKSEYGATAKQAALESLPKGPRQRRLQRQLEKACMDEVQQERQKVETELVEPTDFTTTVRMNYVRHPDQEYASPKGRRVMKTRDGTDIPPERRDTEFLSSFGLTRPPMRAGRSAQEKKDFANSLKNTMKSTTQPEAALSAQPVTIYSQRLAEGCFQGTEVRGANPFARNSTFTNNIGEGHKAHAEAQDTVDGTEPRLTTLGTSLRLGPGAETTLKPMIRSLYRRLMNKYGQQAMTILDDELLRISRAQSSDTKITLPMLRRALRTLGIVFPDRDLSAVFTYLAEQYGEYPSGENSLDAKVATEDIMASIFELDGNDQISEQTVHFEHNETSHEVTNSTDESTARIRVRYNDGRDDIVTVKDPVGFAPHDKSAMLARLHIEGYTNIHSVELDE